MLCERTSPELLYLQTKFAALVSYGLTVEVLKEVLPIGQALNTRSLRRQVQQTAGRLEAELAHKPDAVADAVPPDQNALPQLATPWVVGLDGVYVHVKDQPSRTEGWFEVIVGKRLATEHVLDWFHVILESAALWKANAIEAGSGAESGLERFA